MGNNTLTNAWSTAIRDTETPRPTNPVAQKEGCQIRPAALARATLAGVSEEPNQKLGH